MNAARKGVLKASVAGLVVATICGLLVSTLRKSGPYHVDSAALSGWTLVTEPSGPAFIALQPPPQLAADLFRQAAERSRPALVAPAHPSVPLVLQTEYEDSLQGVLSTEDIMNLAHDTSVDTATLVPVCIGQHRDSTSGQSSELWFVVFESPGFNQFRQQLSPLFPEHAGSAPFDPKALRLILAIAATDNGFARWWPITVDPADCRDSLQVD